MSDARALLLTVDVELEHYAATISRARNPALSNEERLKLITASETMWKRLEHAHTKLVRKTEHRSPAIAVEPTVALRV